MSSALEQMREEAAAGIEPRAGDGFHTAIAEACGNDGAVDTVRSYWSARHGPLFSRLGDYFENPASLERRAGRARGRAGRDPRARRPAARAAMQHLKKATNRYSASWRRANHS